MLPNQLENNKKYDLKDFNDCVLEIWQLAVDGKDVKLFNCIKNILKFIDHVAKEDFTKAKALKDYINRTFQELIQQSIFLYSKEKLQLISEDFSHNCERLFELLQPVAKQYLSGLQSQITKNLPKSLEPLYMRSTGELSIDSELSDEQQAYSLLNSNKATLLKIIEKTQAQNSSEEKNVFKRSVDEYLKICRFQIEITHPLDDPTSFERLVSLFNDIWYMTDKLLEIDYDNYRINTFRTSVRFNQIISELNASVHSDFAFQTIEDLLSRGVHAINQMKKHNIFDLQQLSLLEFRMARLYNKQGNLLKEREFILRAFTHLESCNSMNDLNDINKSDNFTQDFIRTQKIEFLTCSIALLKITAQLNFSTLDHWAGVYYIYKCTKDICERMLNHWQVMQAEAGVVGRDMYEQANPFQLADCHATLETTFEKHMDVVDILISIYVSAAMQPQENNGTNVHIAFFTQCSEAVNYLAVSMVKSYTQENNNTDNNNNNTNNANLNPELILKFRELELKFIEQVLHHAESLIEAKTTDHSIRLLNLNTAATILTNSDRPEVQNNIKLKQRRAGLMSRITDLQTEASQALQNRTSQNNSISTISFLNHLQESVPSANTNQQNEEEKPEEITEKQAKRQATDPNGTRRFHP